jgi:hypothetical protein
MGAARVFDGSGSGCTLGLGLGGITLHNFCPVAELVIRIADRAVEMDELGRSHAVIVWCLALWKEASSVMKRLSHWLAAPGRVRIS